MKIDLGTLPHRDAERIETAMRHVEQDGPVGYHVLAELVRYVRKGVRRRRPYHLAIRERFELVTGHPWPQDARKPDLH